MRSNNSQAINLSVDQADECFKSALRRVAIYLNSSKGHICSKSWLKLNDLELALLFSQKKLDSLLISYLVSAPPKGSINVDKVPNDVRAEHEFYGRFQYQKRKNPSRLHVTFDSSEVFREWSLTRLHKPKMTDDATNMLFNKNAKLAYAQAFTNYLVKNFWHNMIHLRLQGINDLNFHEFGGNAREESDFVADNLANILLLRAYGHPIYVKGSQTPKRRAEYQRVFEMNRCNQVFAERAQQRKEEATELEVFLERGWRFKRQVANTLSSELLMHGAGVTDIAVYFSGESIARGDKRGGYYHSGDVITRLNQVYFNSGCSPYIEDTTLEGLSKERTSVIRNNYSDRIQEIVGAFVTSYINQLKTDSALRNYSFSSISSIEDRIHYW